MRPFRFRLESLLVLRERELDRAVESLAEATRHRATAERELEQARREVETLNRCLMDSRHAAFKGRMQADYLQALREAEEGVRRAAEMLEQTRVHEEECQRRVVAEKQRTDIMKRLKERQRERYQAAEERAAEQAVDEMVSARYAARAG